MLPQRSGPGAPASAAEAQPNLTSSRCSPNASRKQSAARAMRPIDFNRVNHAALALLPGLLRRWLPGGRIEGLEYVALNPRRADHRRGSFRINTRTGRWADFAVEGARGRDVVSLAAYLGGIGQVEAAKRLAAMLGIGERDAR
jgi:hypothetical protein